MNDTFIISLMLIVPFFGFIIPLCLWAMWIRPFLKKNRKTTINAVDWLYSAWADCTTADEISKKQGNRLWFVSAFRFCQYVSSFSIVILIISLAI